MTKLHFKHYRRTLNVDLTTTFKRFHKMEMTQKQEIWMSHEFTKRQKERRPLMCELLLERFKEGRFCIGLLVEMENDLIAIT